MDDEPLERSEQLAALDAHWQAIRAEQRGRLVVIGGEAGVGKTALVRMFCDRVPGGTRVLTGACDALYTPRPLGPFVDIAAAGQPVREAIMSGGRPDEVAVALLEDADVPGPTIVVLEDLHWADEATIDVLRLLARRVDSYRVLVLATYRDDELDRMHPFRVFLGDLSAQLVRLRVPTLTEEAVFELAVRAGVDGRELSLKTGGNPFFVSEVLASPGEEIPDSVRDAVLARVARLGPAGHAVIEAIAVVPHAAELWLVDALVHDDGEGLERCIESGVVTDVEGAVGFRHELARLAVEASLSPVRRTALHHSVMRALAERPASAADSARLAHHAAAPAMRPRW